MTVIHAVYRPWLLIARVTDRCNANCVYCMHNEVTPHPDMPLTLFKKLVDDTQEYVKEVQPIGYGEPLMWKPIVDAVEYARGMGKRCVITTNASLLTPDMSKRLLDAGLSEMRFSIEADSAEVFHHLRKPLKFTETVRNIREFTHLRNEGGYKCFTRYGSCISPENEADVQRITRYFTDELGIDKGWWRRELRKPHPADLDDPYVQSHTPRYVCKHTMQYLSVNWNGNVVLCCYDIYGTYVMGNANEEDALEIFNGTRLSGIRSMFERNGVLPKLCTRFCLHPVKRELWSEKSY